MYLTNQEKLHVFTLAVQEALQEMLDEIDPLTHVGPLSHQRLVRQLAHRTTQKYAKQKRRFLGGKDGTAG
jgi:hypothetical protein